MHGETLRLKPEINHVSCFSEQRIKNKFNFPARRT